MYNSKNLYETYRQNHIEKKKGKSSNIYRLTTGESNVYGYQLASSMVGDILQIGMFENKEFKEFYSINLNDKEFKAEITSFNSDKTFNKQETYKSDLTSSNIQKLNNLSFNYTQGTYFVPLSLNQKTAIISLIEKNVNSNSKITQPKNQSRWSNNGACREGDFIVILDGERGSDYNFDEFEQNALNSFLLKDSNLEVYSVQLPYTNCYINGTIIITYKEKNSNQKWEYKLDVDNNLFDMPESLTVSDMRKL